MENDSPNIRQCPFCGDAMKVVDEVFGHSDSDAPCILARNSWSTEPRHVDGWNNRSGLHYDDD